MGRRKRFDVRCLECQMRKELCICEAILECRRGLETQTRIVILMHHRELVRTTNTARLAERAISNCEIRVRGLLETPLSTEGILDPERHAFLLYPSPDATELNREFLQTLNRPITLIVPDGTWAQTHKTVKREPIAKSVPHVKLALDQPSNYFLRRPSPKGGLATFEAIAQVLGMIEGEAVQARLEALFRLMVQRTLSSRGIRPENARMLWDIPQESGETDGK